MTTINSATARIKGLGENLEEPMGVEVVRLCDFAETLVNGNELRKEELLNIIGFVSVSIQDVLRSVDDPVRKAVKVERLKKKMVDANRQLTDIKANNNNGNHDKVVEIAR